MSAGGKASWVDESVCVEAPQVAGHLKSKVWFCKQLASANFSKDFCVAILSPCQPLLVKARHLDLEGTHTFLNLWCTAGLELPKNDGSDRGRPEPQNRTDLASNFANFQSLYRMLKLLKLGEVIFLKIPKMSQKKCTSFVPKHQTKRYFEESKAVVAILEPFHLFLRETHPNFEEETPVTLLTLHWISTGWWGWPSTRKNIAHMFCRSCRFVVVPMITAPAWGRWLASKKNDVKSRIRKYDLYPKGENRDEAIFHLPWKHLCKSIFGGEIQGCRSLGASFNAKLLLTGMPLTSP